MTKILYFAWVRDVVGLSEEQVDITDDLETITDLATWLALKSDGHRAAFADLSRLRAAVDLVMTPMSALLGKPDEVAFFPPVTGG